MNPQRYFAGTKESSIGFKTRKNKSILLQVDQMILEATWTIMLFDGVLGATWNFFQDLSWFKVLDQLKMNPL